MVDDASPDGTQKVCRELMDIFNTKDKDHVVRPFPSPSRAYRLLVTES